MSTVPARQQGFAAIAAIFLIVLLAALGGFMVTFSNTEQLTSAQDVLGARAYLAARGGLSWGITQIKASSACAASTTLALDGFSVAVTCSTPAAAYTEGGVPILLYRIQSVASAGTVGGVGFVERSVSATYEQ